jgi:hypothetical protein
MALSRDILISGARPQTIADQQEVGELALAWGHAMWRNNLVAKVFCYLSVMRAAGLIPAKSRALVSPDGLRVPQDFQATGNNQAAHYLPGFVAIQVQNAKPRCLWEFVSNNRVRRDVEGLFRATQDLHVSYNRADSAAETKRLSGPPGLKQLFQECCQMVVDQQPPSRPSGDKLVVVDRPMITRVFRRWAEGSIEAYRYAASRKSASIKQKRPADVRDSPRTDLAKGVFREWTVGDLEARSRDLRRTVSGSKGTVEEFADQESFVRAYANVTNGSFPLHESIVHEIELPFGPQMPDWFVSNSDVV